MQLLAAWLAGLIILNGSFLTAASQINEPNWAAGFLVVASVVNVPLFLISLFVLQTKFRPEMQEDEYYARYLERRYSENSATTEYVEIAAPAKHIELQQSLSRINEQVAFGRKQKSKKTKISIQINDLLPNYSEVEKRLKDSGFRIEATFGSTSLNQAVPEVFIIAFGELNEIEFTELKKAISIAAEWGLEGLKYSTEASHKAYIGAYSYEVSPYAELDDDLHTKIMKRDVNFDKFKQTVLNHSTQPARPGPIAKRIEKAQ